MSAESAFRLSKSPWMRIGIAVMAMVLAATASLCPASDDPVAAERSRALLDDPMASDALVHVLRYHFAKDDGEGGFGWWLRLPFPVRARQALVPKVRFWRNRLEFLRDSQRRDAAACAVSGGMVLRDPLIDEESRLVETRRLEQCRRAAPTSDRLAP